MKETTMDSPEELSKPGFKRGRLAATLPTWLAVFAFLGIPMLMPGHTPTAGKPPPQQGPMAHVESVVVHINTLPHLGSRHKFYQKYAEASVVVVDDFGYPVMGAKVTGIFSGNLLDLSTASATTDEFGEAILDSKSVSYDSGPLSFTFCVTKVASSLAWDGVEVCDTASY